MKNSNIFSILILAIAVVGCVNLGPKPVLSAEAKAIPIMKSDPPEKCQKIASLKSYGLDGDERKLRLRDQAFKKGANYIRLDTITRTGNTRIFYGTGFKCK